MKRVSDVLRVAGGTITAGEILESPILDNFSDFASVQYQHEAELLAQAENPEDC
jgi:hypothetical protein